jgi:hypothetical protein
MSGLRLRTPAALNSHMSDLVKRAETEIVFRDEAEAFLGAIEELYTTVQSCV